MESYIVPNNTGWYHYHIQCRRPYKYRV